MLKGLLQARSTRFTAYALLYGAIVLGALGLVNWLANRYNRSVDTTAEKRYSLSDQTEKLVRDLKQNVTLTYFDQSNNFPQARDLLDRYDNLSSRLTVNYVDPDRQPGVARQAGFRGNGSVVLQGASQREEASSATEEEITGALKRLLKGAKRTVCAVNGSGEHRFDDRDAAGYGGLAQVLGGDAYQTRSITLLEQPQVPADCTVLLVGGPKFDYPEGIVNNLKTYVENGGRAMFLLDPPAPSGRFQTSANVALAAMLAGWGVTANPDIVYDFSPLSQIAGFGPEIPLVLAYESHPITREMTRVATAYPVTRSLEVASGNSAQALAKSSSNSFATTDFNATEVNPTRDKRGPLTLAAAGTRKPASGKGEGRFVVVGSSTWATNRFLDVQGNRNMVLNMMNWLSSDEDLISIRPKDPQDRRLNLSRAQMSTVFFLSVVLMPVAVVLAGLRVWWTRR